MTKSTEWKEIFVNCPDDRGVMCRIYKELQKLNTKIASSQ